MDISDIKTYRSWLPLSLAACRNDLAQLLLRLRGIGLRESVVAVPFETQRLAMFANCHQDRAAEAVCVEDQ